MKRIPLNSGFWISVFAVGLIWILINDLGLTQTVPQSNSVEIPSKLDVPVYKMPASPSPQAAPLNNNQDSATLKFVSPQIVEFLSDQRPIGELTDKELKKRSLQAKDFAQINSLPAPIIAQLQTVAATTQEELNLRGQKSEPIIEEISPTSAVIVTDPPADPTGQSPLSPEVTIIIQDQRPLSALTVEELAARASKTRRLARQVGMAVDLRDKLLAMSEAARSELANRTLSVLPDNRIKLYKSNPQDPAAPPVLISPPPSPTLKPPGAATNSPQSSASNLPPDLPDFLKKPASGTATQPAPITSPPHAPPVPVTVPLPPEVVQLLSEKRQLSELNANELTTRFMLARQYAKDSNLPVDRRQALALTSEAARQELERRQSASQITTTPPPDRILKVTPPLVEAPVKTSLPNPVPDKSSPDFLGGALTAPLPPPQQLQVPAVKEVKENTEAEHIAQNLIATDPATIETLSYGDLRQRLDEMRKTLATNQLSPETHARLRQRLAKDRDMLRRRIASATGTTPTIASPLTTPPVKLPVIGRVTLPSEAVILGGDPLPKPDRDYIPKSDVANNQAPLAPQTMLPLPLAPAPPITLADDRQALAVDKLVTGQDAVISAPVLIPPEAVLNDRRAAEQVSDVELVKRLQVYRQAVNDKQFSTDQRAYWKAMMKQDSNLLDQHLLAERERRRLILATQPVSTAQEIGGVTIFNNTPASTIDAAEVSDRELLENLTANPPLAPRDKFYKLSEVEASPSLRFALPHIDMDTIYFGFNESTLGPEEVANLNRLGILIERVLSRFPNETFFIEGHTDAVGSAPANQRLSLQRAEAVKQALSRYFVIPEKNLLAIGYGERFLKIPTLEAETENRRVSISRATPLIGPVQN